jgi:uncharacterized protein
VADAGADVRDLGYARRRLLHLGAAQHFGAGIVNEPGAMSWNELRSPDPRSVQNFYTQLFGWSYHETDMGGGLAYVGVNVGG